MRIRNADRLKIQTFPSIVFAFDDSFFENVTKKMKNPASRRVMNKSPIIL